MLKLKGLQDIDQFQLELYHQRLDMIHKTNMPEILAAKPNDSFLKSERAGNLNNLVNGVPIFKPSTNLSTTTVASSIFQARKYSQPIKATLSTPLSKVPGHDSYKQLYFK